MQQSILQWIQHEAVQTPKDTTVKETASQQHEKVYTTSRYMNMEPTIQVQTTENQCTASFNYMETRPNTQVHMCSQMDRENNKYRETIQHESKAMHKCNKLKCPVATTESSACYSNKTITTSQGRNKHTYEVVQIQVQIQEYIYTCIKCRGTGRAKLRKIFQKNDWSQKRLQSAQWFQNEQ